jgi:hypothetical protein
MISRRKKAMCTLLEETKGSRMPETGTRERKTGTEKRRKGALKHTGCDHNWRKGKKLYSRQIQELKKCSEGGLQKKSRELGFLVQATTDKDERAGDERTSTRGSEKDDQGSWYPGMRGSISVINCWCTPVGQRMGFAYQ